MNKPRTTPRIFLLFPATDYSTLIMRHGRHSDEFLEAQFADAADRLANSFEGKPNDDFILLPWLYLSRHAVELAMKRSILFSSYLRRNNGERDRALDGDEVHRRLKHEYGHRLAALLDELDRNLTALDLPVTHKTTRRIVQLLGEADPSGEAFRYADQLPDTQDRVDFPSMRDAVSRAYGEVSATYDMLDNYGQIQADYLAEVEYWSSELESDYYGDQTFY